jgi:hypothetical protein
MVTMSDAVPASARYPVHRSTGGITLAWVWIGAVAVLVASVVWVHGSLSELGGALVVLATVGPAYVWGLRPRMEENPEEIYVANPLRDVHLPWSALTYARVRYTLELSAADGTEVSVFAVPRETPSQRFRRNSRGSGVPFLGGPPDAVSSGMSAPERLAYDLNERVERRSGGQAAAPVVVEWASTAVWALVASVASALLGFVMVVF